MRAADRPTGSHGTMKIRKGTVRMLYCRDTFQLFLSDIEAETLQQDRKTWEKGQRVAD